ncbi:helix-turn-helix domain-containing protein [Meiothermus cerbereus]|uniref:helix-turn-helix domain-containing protein n=1 Tax=Meiothermus cerbereus TaxID=65552 RepID=UPI003EEF6E80
MLRLAAAGPVGPSSVSRALGIAKSSASDRLRRLERLGLLVKQGSSYLATK